MAPKAPTAPPAKATKPRTTFTTRAATNAGQRTPPKSFSDAAADLARIQAVQKDGARHRRELQRLRTAARIPAGTTLTGKNGGIRISTGRIINPEFVRTNKIDAHFPVKDTLILRSRESKGLKNIDSWRCYWIATLQCVAHAPPIYHLLGNLHRDCQQTERQCMVCGLQSFVQSYWNGNQTRSTKTISTADIHAAAKRTIAADDPVLGDYHDSEQNDPFCYIDFLRTQLLTVSDPAQRASVEEVFYFGQDHLFDCVACGLTTLIHSVTDCFGLGPIDLRTPALGLNVEQLIRQNYMFDPDLLPYTCSSAACMRAQSRPGYTAPHQQRYIRLTSCPDVLVIQLTRTALDLYGNEFKVMTDHDFPEILDLSEYLADPSAQVRYRFSGMVAHHGNEIGAGHYIAGVRGAVEGSGFRLINDSRRVVHTNNFADIQQPMWDKKDRFQPYVLYYTKIRGKK